MKQPMESQVIQDAIDDERSEITQHSKFASGNTKNSAMNISSLVGDDSGIQDTASFTPPEWMVEFIKFRERLFLRTIEPVIVALLGPLEDDDDNYSYYDDYGAHPFTSPLEAGVDATHRRLGFLPAYVEDAHYFRETSMSMASCAVLFAIMSCILLIFLSCFYHNQKTSPLFISPRRHRLPKLVPPPLPIDGYFAWVKVCFLMSDEEIIQRIGFDTLIFLRFHRLALRCIVKMSIFSFVVLLPLNYTGGGHANAQDLKGYFQSLLLTDFMRFSMANIVSGSPRLWAHCFAIYLLTGIVVRELLVEYETFNSIRHTYLLSREPHLRTVLVTNIPRHLRSANKITSYFRHVYPDAVKNVFMCQNLIRLEELVKERTSLLSKIEKELLMLCRKEKKNLFERSKRWKTWRKWKTISRLEDFGIVDGAQERLTSLYSSLEELNDLVEQEQRRRRRVMKMMDRMEAGEGKKDIDYILAAPFVVTEDANQRRVLGLEKIKESDEEYSGNYKPPQAAIADRDNRGMAVLRSRSPRPEGEQQNVDIQEPLKLNKKPRAKQAKTAIKRYSQRAREVSFFGRPIQPLAAHESAGHIEDHINEVTDKAFVVMSSYTAATIAIQSMHSSKPGAMQVQTAPEPRDVLWRNIYVSKGATRTRLILGDFLVILIISFYVVPIALVSLLVSEAALVSFSPRLAQLDQASAFFASAIAMVQPICIVTLQQVLPPLFMAIGRMEGIVSFSEVQMRAFSRYFLFQVLNVFLVTTIAGSIFDTIAIIVENPESAFEMLGNSLPRLSSFFITFVTVKTFFGLGLELVRTVAIIQATLRYLFVPNMTLRMARGVICGMRAIDDPGWFPFHKILAQDMLVVVISVVFAVVAPLVLLPCALFCLFSRIMWTHHHLYVYESVFESGGQFWPKIFRRFVFGLIIAQMTITGQFILKEARHEAYATIALMFMTYLFLRSTRARYDPTSSTLPLEVATVMDISIGQEQEARRKAQEAADLNHQERPAVARSRSYESSSAYTLGETVGSSEQHDRETETHIGGYDPYELAYMQPVLRANPRAKPEQPFPPAQLGSEQALFLDHSVAGHSNLMDCTANVRLKSLNQQDRRQINRWWNDQLKRAGPQNMIPIFTGTECGTLAPGEKKSTYDYASHLPSNDNQFV